MRPGREVDCAIAEKVFGHRVFIQKRDIWEVTSKGERPLKRYSKEMEWAWEVAERMSISLIPIEGGQWFAFAGNEMGWRSPAEFIEFLQAGQFMNAGAAVGAEAPLMICTAALKAIESRKAADEANQDQEPQALQH